MATGRVFRRHDAAAQAAYQELKRLALGQARVLSGSPGTLKHRTRGGRRYTVREHVRADGRKVDEYVGAQDGLDQARIAALGAEIELAKALAAGSARMRLFGYQRVERKPAAVLATLFNSGLVGSGLALVGSHAYGALLNELGVNAAGYRTQDVDVARGRPLAVALPHGMTFQGLLAQSGLKFAAVPGLPSHRPSASFKLPGAEGLAVDLLAAGEKPGALVAVQELGAHAQAIPLLDFLLDEPVDGVVLSPNQVVPVRLPAPERFALHKLFSSQSRRAQRDKIGKDLDQAAVLAAALEEETPGALRDAFRHMPRAGRAMASRGARAAAARLRGVHPAGEAALLRIAGR